MPPPLLLSLPLPNRSTARGPLQAHKVVEDVAVVQAKGGEPHVIAAQWVVGQGKRTAVRLLAVRLLYGCMPSNTGAAPGPLKGWFAQPSPP